MFLNVVTAIRLFRLSFTGNHAKMAFRDAFDSFAQHIIPDLYRPCILKVEMVIFFFSDKVIF